MAIISFPTLLALRDIAPDWLYSITGSGLVLLGAIVAAGLRYPRVTAIPHAALWLYAQLATASLSAVVALTFGIVPFLSIIGNSINLLAALAITFFISRAQIDSGQVIDILVKSLVAMLLASTVLFLFGVEPASTAWNSISRASMINNLGITIRRADFPLTRGSVSHASLCGIVLVAMWFHPGAKLLRVLAFAAALFGCALADGRAALFFSLVIIVYGQFFRFAGIRMVPLAFIVTAPVYMLAVNFLPTNLLILLSRSGDATELLTGSDRAVVWQQALTYMSNNWMIAFFGAGQLGQITVGLFTGSFGYNFINFKDINNMSLHNAAMQVWIDSGLAGVAVMTSFLFAACKWLERGRHLPGTKTAAAMLVYTILNGGFSTYGTIYWDDGFYAVTLIGAATLVSMPLAYGRQRELMLKY